MRVSQIFLKLGDKTIRDYPVYMFGMNKFKKLTDDYHLMNDLQADKLMKNYPEFYPMWKNVRFSIMKVDILRFIILYHYGGLVADLDVIPLVKSLKFEGVEDDTILIFTPKKFNYEVLYSKKHNDYWLEFLRYVKTQIEEKSKIKVYENRKGRYVLNTTGPYAFKRFLKMNPNPKVELIPMNRFVEADTIDDTMKAIKSKKYPFITLQTTSWLESIGVKEHYTDKIDNRQKIMDML
jgi:hypothetical protein